MRSYIVGAKNVLKVIHRRLRGVAFDLDEKEEEEEEEDEVEAEPEVMVIVDITLNRVTREEEQRSKSN